MALTYSHFMDIKDTNTLVSTIEAIAPYNVGWALTDRVGDINNLASARLRTLSYKEFDIPKKSGGTRRITAPIGKLKDVLKCLSVILTPYYESGECVHGFTTQRSVASNASVHMGKNYVLNIDLKDFFPSITATRVQKALQKHGLNSEVAHLISRLTTLPMAIEDSQALRNALPQGSPCSPLLSNMVCADLDRKLMGLARRFRVDYTRYADDMTFSSNHHVYAAGGEFFAELRRIIEDCGFTINERKTRLQKRGSRQEVTGVIVNEKTNAHRSFRKNLRAAVFAAETFGCTRKEYNSIMGKISYLSMLLNEDRGCIYKYKAIMSKVIIKK